MNIKIYGFVAILLLIAACASAQTNAIKFNLVQGPDGRPLGKINAIAQDANGYIWLAGQGEKCLYRYDGTRWTVYRNDLSNPATMGVTYVETICIDLQGNIWIGGEGLDRFNPNTGVFEHFHEFAIDPTKATSNFVGALLADSKGRICIGTNGL